MKTNTGCLRRAPVTNIIFLKLFRITFYLFLWLVEIYEQKDMLFLIGVTPLAMKTTRRRRQPGAEAEWHSHKKGHRWRQQQNSDDDKTPTTPTLTKMLVYQQGQWLWDAESDNGNNWYKINIIFSLTVSKNNNKEWSVAITYQIFFVLNYQRKCCVKKKERK